MPIVFDAKALEADELERVAREEEALRVPVATAVVDGVVESKSEAGTMLHELNRLRPLLCELAEKRGSLEQMVHALDEEIASAEGRASGSGSRLDQAIREGSAAVDLERKRVVYAQRRRIAQGENPQKLALESVVAAISTLDSHLSVLRSQVTQWQKQVSDSESAITRAQSAKAEHLSTHERLEREKTAKEAEKRGDEARKTDLEREKNAFNDEEKREGGKTNSFEVKVRSCSGPGSHSDAGIWLKGSKLAPSRYGQPTNGWRGLHIAFLNRHTGDCIDYRVFDTWETPSETPEAVAYINQYRNQSVIAVVVSVDESTSQRTSALSASLGAMGVTEYQSLGNRGAWYFVRDLGQPIDRPRNPLEKSRGNEETLFPADPVGFSWSVLAREAAEVEREFSSKRQRKNQEIDATQANIDRLAREIRDLDQRIGTESQQANDEQSTITREQAANATKNQDIQRNEETITLFTRQREAKERQRTAIQNALDTGTPMPTWEEERVDASLDAQALQAKRAQWATQQAELARVNEDYKAAQAALMKFLPLSESLSPLIQAIVTQNASSVKQLLAVGADANAAWAEGWTPLHYACFYLNSARADSMNIVRQLLAAGASLKAVNAQSMSAYSFALGDHEAWVVNTALNSAARNGDIAEVEYLLTQPGVNINTPVAIAPSDRYAGHNGWVDEGRNPLAWVICGAAKVNIMRLLLANGADPNQGNRTGWSALHQAAVFYNDHPEASAEALRILVEAGGRLTDTVMTGEPPQAKSVLDLGNLPETLKSELTASAERLRTRSSTVLRDEVERLSQEADLVRHP